jgi:hypothetical protein
MSDDRWTYVVPLVDPDGERRVIVVTLSPEERASALYNLAVNPDGPGGDNGCIVRAYAMGHAQSRMRPGATIEVGGIKRVVLH